MIVLSHHISLLSYMYYFQASNLHLPASQQKQAQLTRLLTQFEVVVSASVYGETGTPTSGSGISLMGECKKKLLQKLHLCVEPHILDSVKSLWMVGGVYF